MSFFLDKKSNLLYLLNDRELFEASGQLINRNNFVQHTLYEVIRVDNGFARKGSDVHHHVKNGVTACTGSFGGFFGNGSRYDGLDEGTANHQYDQHGHNNPAFAALRQTVKP